MDMSWLDPKRPFVKLGKRLDRVIFKRDDTGPTLEERNAVALDRYADAALLIGSPDFEARRIIGERLRFNVKVHGSIKEPPPPAEPAEEPAPAKNVLKMRRRAKP